MLAGVMYALTGVVDRQGPLYPRFFTLFSDYLVQYAFLAALVATLVALVGLHALQRSNLRMDGDGWLRSGPGWA